MPLERREGLEPSWAEAGPEQRAAYLSEGLVPGDYPEPVAADWPELLAIVRDRVKPLRDSDNRDAYRKNWWRFAERRSDLARSIQFLDLVLLTNCGATPNLAFASAASRTVFSNTLAVFAISGFDRFAILQSRLHEVWARFFSSSLEDRLRYTPTDCLETFPFPTTDVVAELGLATAGQAFHDARAARMVAAGEGLTATHNRMDDPEEQDPAIIHLRALHAAMDEAVLRAYAWPHPIPVFEPEWPGGEDDRPGPWRRRWPEADRARVLEFLWQLNEAQAATQSLPGKFSPPRPKRPRNRLPSPPPAGRDLLETA